MVLRKLFIIFRYASVAVKFISSEGSSTVVKVIQSASPDQQDGINPEIRKRSYGETSQFQENFEVYIQALISQCLDANFLDEVFNDAGTYFFSFLWPHWNFFKRG